MKKRLMSFLLVMIFCVNAMSVIVFAEDESTNLEHYALSNRCYIEYDSEVFGHIPSQTFYVDGNKYKQYTVLTEYEGLTVGDIIYVDSEGYLVTDTNLLQKLVYTAIIRSSVCVGGDLENILTLTNTVKSSLDIIDDLGNDLIEKTIASAIACNFKGIIAAAKGDLVDYAEEYADFISSAGIEGTLYLSYLMNLDSLTNLCINNLNDLLDFNDTVKQQVDRNGISYEDAKRYEHIIKNCVGTLQATSEYLVYLAQCVSGNRVNDSVDAIGVLSNMGMDFVGDAFGKGISLAFTEDIASLLDYCSGFDELFKTTYDSLGIDEKINDYYNAYKLYDSGTPYFIDINDVVNNVAILTKEEIPYDSVEQEFITKIESLKNEYPHGKYWSNKNGQVSSGIYRGSSAVGDYSCSKSYTWCSSCGTFKLNGSDIAWQCHGYALLLAHKLFGSNANKWTKYTDKNRQIYAGDVIRIDMDGDGINDDYDHTIFVYKVTSTHIYYTDCNNIGPCKINWQGKMTFADLKSVLLYVRHLEGNTLTGTGEIIPTLTVNYNANGGMIPEAQAIGETYKITTSAGLNIRSTASTGGTVLGAIPQNIIVNVVEKKAGGTYTWGRVSYNGKEGWIALDSSYVTKVGVTWNQKYYVNSSMVYKTSTSKTHSQVLTYGVTAPDGLYNATTFGLYRDGYTFKGWSLSASGDTIIDQNTSFKPEELVPTLVNGDQTVTVYAVWEKNDPIITDHTVESIYISSIPKNEVYYVGDSLDTSDISILVEHTDGYIQKITKGFACSPSVLSTEGEQEIVVTYQGKTAKFSIQVTKSKNMVNNATAIKNSMGYLMPNSSAETIKGQGVWKNDTLQVLCKDGDYYLCLIPWGATTTTKSNGVLLYISVDDIQLNSNVPDAAEFYSMNPTGKNNATVIEDTKIYYRPDGGATPVIYANAAVAENTVTKDSQVRILFEMEDYYCIQTDKYTGFVSKSAVKLTTYIREIYVENQITDVLVGDEFSLEDVKIKGVLNDGSVIELTEFTTILPETDSSGEKYGVVTYGEFSAILNISVNEVKISGISVDQMPEKLIYLIGEEFDAAGLALSLIYENGNTEDISEAADFNYDFSESGPSFVEVRYDNYVAYVPVTIYEKPEIEILDVVGYSGQHICIPIYYFSGCDSVLPISFNMTLSYNYEKIKYIGLDSSWAGDTTGLTINRVDADTISLKYIGTEVISTDYVLSSLEFEILESGKDVNYEDADIWIESVELFDSFGNAIDVSLVDGLVLNLGKLLVTFSTPSDEEFGIYAVNYGETVQISDDVPTREGYDFVGWSTVEGSKQAEYGIGDSFECTENICLFAVWCEKTQHEPDESETAELTEEDTSDRTETAEKSETTTKESQSETAELTEETSKESESESAELTEEDTGNRTETTEESNTTSKESGSETTEQVEEDISDNTETTEQVEITSKEPTNGKKKGLFGCKSSVMNNGCWFIMIIVGFVSTAFVYKKRNNYN
ncbi:MAG: bacterial Ig-like domain-containing protein [Clostridia bacterium]|nr:bacterial Ig-like domain-containing protein [Clostridia bacterium]